MKRYEFNENRLGEVTIEESNNGRWIKCEDYIKMMNVASHEPKDLLADIEEGNMIIVKKNKEIKRLKKIAIKHLDRYTECDQAGSEMSAELTYLRGVINCALGKHYPSDIGCEDHELNKKIFEEK